MAQQLKSKARDQEQVRRALQGLGLVGNTSQISIHPVSRMMSKLWRVVISDDGADDRYIVKKAGAFEDRQAVVTQRQASIMKSFADNCADQDYFESVFVGYCRDEGLLVLTESDLPNLTASLTRAGLPSILRGLPDLRASIRLTGHWLRHWHDTTRQTGSLSDPLHCYMQERTRRLNHLPEATRERLIELVQSCPDGDIVTTHSDLTLHNILTDGRHISVIDPGIWEWSDMSPYWDVCTFLQSLEGLIHFAWPRPITWNPGAFAILQRDFLEAYGEPDCTVEVIYTTCAAVRHFISFVKYVEKEDNKSAAWYLQKLEQNLTSLESVK